MLFCTQCGKKLEDGETCSCQTEIKETAGKKEENTVQNTEQVLQIEETAAQDQPEAEVPEQEQITYETVDQDQKNDETSCVGETEDKAQGTRQPDTEMPVQDEAVSGMTHHVQPGAGDPDQGQPGSGGIYQGHPVQGIIYRSHQGGSVPYQGQPETGEQYQGQPGPGAPYQGQPGAGALYQGQPGAGAPYQGQPGAGAPYQGQPGAGAPYQGQPGAGALYQGQPGAGAPYQGQPGAGAPYQGQPGAGAPYQGYPGAGAPYQGHPGAGAPYQGYPGAGAPYQGQPGQGQYQGAYPGYYGQNHRQQGAFGAAFSGMWKTFINGLKNPESIKQFTAKGELKEGMLLLGAESVMTALYILVVVLRTLSGTDGLGGAIFLVFLSVLIASFGINLAFAGIFMPIYRGISKQPVTFGQSVCCVAARTIAVLPFLAGGIIFGILLPLFSYMIIGLGGILGYFFFFIGMKGVTRSSDSRIAYTAFLGFLVNNAISIVIYVFVILGIGSAIFRYAFDQFSFLF